MHATKRMYVEEECHGTSRTAATCGHIFSSVCIVQCANPNARQHAKEHKSQREVLKLFFTALPQIVGASLKGVVILTHSTLLCNKK